MVPGRRDADIDRLRRPTRAPDSGSDIRESDSPTPRSFGPPDRLGSALSLSRPVGVQEGRSMARLRLPSGRDMRCGIVRGHRPVRCRCQAGRTIVARSSAWMGATRPDTGLGWDACPRAEPRPRPEFDARAERRERKTALISTPQGAPRPLPVRRHVRRAPPPTGSSPPQTPGS